ncbi:hypothetical protein [Actinoplanes sp. N902-109]|uniref:hypothetical protein n=1 Tax=Actinoplanes sp. (strain N902-109) TaxID=649831 RepID=UPI0003295AD4|nr:hypothetical protein [Actinoplanes sp. N902-109]AGL14122.1 hypothetical protein L083_0612 [Actinoplanes sp. N902-109]
MIHLTWTELRRSNARTLAILLIAVSAVLLALDGMWRGQWLRLIYNHDSSLFVLLPLALAGGAILGRRDRRTGVHELVGATPRPRVARTVPPAAALAAAAAGAHLLIFAVATVIVAVNGSYLSVAPIAMALAGAVVLVGGTWLGLAAGRAWSSPLVPPALAVLGLVLQFSASESTPGELNRLSNLSLLAQPPGSDWEAPTAQAVFSRLALGVGFAAAGFLLTAGSSWLPRVVAVPVLAGALVAAAVLPGTTMAGRYRIDPGAERLVCSGQVCLTAAHANLMDEVAPQVRRALTLLAKLPGAPQRAVEWRSDRVWELGDSIDAAGAQRAEPDILQIDLDLGNGKPGPHLTESALLGAGTRWNGCYNGESVAQYAAGAWLLGTDDMVVYDGFGAPPGDFGAEVRQTVAKLRQLPPDEQVRRVTALRDASADCVQDLMPYLTDGVRP